MTDYTRGDDPVYKEFRESHQYNQLQDANREIDELTYELDEYRALGTVEELAALKKALEMACTEVARNAQYKPPMPPDGQFGEATIKATAAQYERDIIQQAKEADHADS